MLNLNHLNVFRTVAQEMSITVAAKRLHLSQSSVSTQVRALEEEFGLRLFERRGKRLELNEVGRAFLERTEHLLAAADEFLQSVSELRGEAEAQLVVGANSAAGSYLLPPIVQTFRSRYPRTNTRLFIENTSSVWRGVAEHRLDLGVAVQHPEHHELHESSGIRFETLFEEPFLLVTAADHEMEALDLEALSSLSLILPPRGSLNRTLIDRELERHGIEPLVIFEVQRTDAIKHFLEMRQASSFLLRMSVERELKAGKLKAVPVEGLELRARFLAGHDPAHHEHSLREPFLTGLREFVTQLRFA